jgi:hypothetical protein
VDRFYEVAEQIVDDFEDSSLSLKVFPLRERITIALRAARDEALEDAAKVAVAHDMCVCDCDDDCSGYIAKDIRALKLDAGKP